MNPSARPMVRPSTGFTLVEVLVSLVIAGSAALLAHGLFSVSVSASADLRAARNALDRTANVNRFLAAAFFSLDVSGDQTGPFVGGADRMRFTGWLETADGWFERREIVLSLENGRLVAGITPGGSMVLAESVSELAFDYMLEPGAQSHWVSGWISPVSAPLAVRFRITRSRADGAPVSDTTIYLIKARG